MSTVKLTMLGGDLARDQAPLKSHNNSAFRWLTVKLMSILLTVSYQRRCPQQWPRAAAQATELDGANALQHPLDVAVMRPIGERIKPFCGLSR